MHLWVIFDFMSSATEFGARTPRNATTVKPEPATTAKSRNLGPALVRPLILS